MKHLLIILSFLFLSSTLLGQSKEDCYLFISGDIGEDMSTVDQIVRPLISSFVSPLKKDPFDGLRLSDLDSSCYYEVLMTKTDDTLNLSISGQSTPTPFNGFSKSSRSFPENVRHSTLRVLHNELNKSKKDEICSKYSEILVDECPQNQNLMITFNKYSERNIESLMKEPRANLVSGFTSMLESIDTVNFIGISEIDTDNDFQNNLKRMIDKRGANSCLVITTEWNFQKQETSMWKGLVS